MATPQYNIKTQSDSTIYVSREVTGSDVAAGTYTEDKIGLIMANASGIDYKEYPYLTRRTGDSLRGQTEQITSNEFRKGRTKSAPRKGVASSDGSISYELSPDTYDEFLEAVFRNRFTAWSGDGSAGKLKSKFVNADNETANENDTSVDLIYAAGGSGFLKVADTGDYEIAELKTGNVDIKFDILKQFGGVEGEDLFQEFEHEAVDSMSMSITPGQIITGDFNFMGSNDPDLLEKGSSDSEGIRKKLTGRFVTPPASLSDYIDNLPNESTKTDQLTASQGFLYANGIRTRYGSNLTFSLSNGLRKTNAIFEKDAIATSALSLDITGNLDVYLVGGHADKLYNLATQDKTVELLFVLQDKEENPDYALIFQIFTTKFDKSVNNGEEMGISLPWTSFGESACRILRVRKRRVTNATLGTDNESASLFLTSEETGIALSDFEVASIKYGDTEVSDLAIGTVSDNEIPLTFTAPSSGTYDVEMNFKLNGIEYKKVYKDVVVS